MISFFYFSSTLATRTSSRTTSTSRRPWTSSTTLGAATKTTLKIFSLFVLVYYFLFLFLTLALHRRREPPVGPHRLQEGLGSPRLRQEQRRRQPGGDSLAHLDQGHPPGSLDQLRCRQSSRCHQGHRLLQARGVLLSPG